MFSPFYAAARKKGDANPLDHCAVNVALYGPGGNRWAMTEQPRRSVHRSNDDLAIGQSALSWDGAALTVTIDERTVPMPSRIKGSVTLHPGGIATESWPLDDEGYHRWRPIAPAARIEVALDRPGLRWAGDAYLDSNCGDVPLEDSFTHWTWSRAKLGTDTGVLYDVERRNGRRHTLALQFDETGTAKPFTPPPKVALAGTRWRMNRETRADARHTARVERTFEDTPFYARSLVSTHLLGQPARAIHESLSLDRFSKNWVQWMLPFRMTRISS